MDLRDFVSKFGDRKNKSWKMDLEIINKIVNTKLAIALPGHSAIGIVEPTASLILFLFFILLYALHERAEPTCSPNIPT